MKKSKKLTQVQMQKIKAGFKAGSDLACACADWRKCSSCNPKPKTS